MLLQKKTGITRKDIKNKKKAESKRIRPNNLSFLFPFFLIAFLFAILLFFLINLLLTQSLFGLFPVFFLVALFSPLCVEFALFSEQHRTTAAILALFPELAAAFRFRFFDLFIFLVARAHGSPPENRNLRQKAPVRMHKRITVIFSPASLLRLWLRQAALLQKSAGNQAESREAHRDHRRQAQTIRTVHRYCPRSSAAAPQSNPE